MAYNHIPAWVKWLQTAFVCVLVPAYWVYYGPTNFLWFSDIALLTSVVALWTRSSLLASMQAVAVTALEFVWIADFLLRLFADVRLIDLSEYMFDPTIPLWLRALSLFHVWMPLLLLYALGKLGYDRRAFWIQTAVALCILPICYYGFDPSLQTNDTVMPHVLGLPFDRDFNINWVHAFYDRPEPELERRRFWTVLLGYPLAVHLPTHLLLSLRPWSRIRTVET